MSKNDIISIPIRTLRSNRNCPDEYFHPKIDEDLWLGLRLSDSKAKIYSQRILPENQLCNDSDGDGDDLCGCLVVFIFYIIICILSLFQYCCCRDALTYRYYCESMESSLEKLNRVMNLPKRTIRLGGHFNILIDTSVPTLSSKNIQSQVRTTGTKGPTETVNSSTISIPNANNIAIV